MDTGVSTKIFLLTCLKMLVVVVAETDEVLQRVAGSFTEG